MARFWLENTLMCDGHNFQKIEKALKSRKKEKPLAIIAKTIKGHGVSFMEKNNDWHHGRLTKNFSRIDKKLINLWAKIMI